MAALLSASAAVCGVKARVSLTREPIHVEAATAVKADTSKVAIVLDFFAGAIYGTRN